MRCFTLFAVLLCAGGVSAQTLDVPTMGKGEKGKLPKTTDKRKYHLGRVLDDEVLISMLELQGNSWRIQARFWITDAGMVKKYEKQENGSWLALDIELPDVYEVVGRRSINGIALPVLVKVPEKKKK